MTAATLPQPTLAQEPRYATSSTEQESKQFAAVFSDARGAPTAARGSARHQPAAAPAKQSRPPQPTISSGGLPTPAATTSQCSQPTTPAAEQLANLSLSTPATAQAASDTHSPALQIDSSTQPQGASELAATYAAPPAVSAANAPVVAQECDRHSAADRADWWLECEEMNEKERLAVEQEAEERAEQLRAVIEADNAEMDQAIREQSGAFKAKYNEMQAKHDKEMSAITGKRTAQEIASEVKQWQANLTERQIEEGNLEVEDRVSDALDVEQLELECREYCNAAIALIDAEFERQRRMEEDEDGEVDEELAAELRQETLVFARGVDVYKQAVERLRQQVAEEADKQKKVAEMLEAAKELRLKRLEQIGS